LIKIDEPIAMVRNSQSYFYHFDGLGSVTVLTDSSGNVVQRYNYDSFGNITYMQDPNFKQPYTYTSREYDEEIGLYYYRARYYNAKIGRFMSEDPIGFAGGINKYIYVGNNPLRYKDPKGKDNCESDLTECIEQANEKKLECVKNLTIGYTVCLMICPIGCLAAAPVYPACVAACEAACAAGADGSLAYCHGLEIGEVAFCYINYYKCKKDEGNKKKCNR
jgi:RHS repeat-associated protein